MKRKHSKSYMLQTIEYYQKSSDFHLNNGSNEQQTQKTCHGCNESYNEIKLIHCRKPNCKLYYCHKCLSGNYKFSKFAIGRLPINTEWFCPSCHDRCFCQEFAYLLKIGV